MLSYQHTFHAGNFADVIKHALLSRILFHMTQKDTPLFYLETHSGRGFYDLTQPDSLKTNEADQGIHFFWKIRTQLPVLFNSYLEHLQKLNLNKINNTALKSIRYYPGSPHLAIQMLRKQDRLYLCELHPTEFEKLKQLSKQGNKVHFEQCDGLSKLSALLPPLEKRGCIFIDPSYEIKTEYKEIAEKVMQAYKKFSTGTYCLWYPILPENRHIPMLKKLQALNPDKTKHIEWNFTNKIATGMRGCGLLVINPPYGLLPELDELNSWKSKFI